jgi:hypothetical protein
MLLEFAKLWGAAKRRVAVSLFENLDRCVVQLAGDEVQSPEFSYLRKELTTVRFGFD